MALDKAYEPRQENSLALSFALSFTVCANNLGEIQHGEPDLLPTALRVKTM